jgi:hypothetical protein
MATFTVDLLTGSVYLFTGNFSGSGSTPTSGSTYPEVQTFANLPPASSAAGEIYVVRVGTGSYVYNRKDSGFYFSTGTVWRNLGDTPQYFKSDNFQVYDSVDPTKGLSFVTSGITGGVFRKVKIQNSDGTIAYLTDLNSKVNISAFADYTGTTAPATYLTKSAFNVYSAQTFSLIGTKQDKLIAGSGISIVGNVISTTGSSNNQTLQLLNISGGTDINSVTPVSIVWNSQIFSGTSLGFTGGSRIYIKASGIYEISYALNVRNETSSPKNVGTLIRKNGNSFITPMSSSSYNQNDINKYSANVMPEYLVSLSVGDYVELIAFRIGGSGISKTVSNGVWLKMKKK